MNNEIIRRINARYDLRIDDEHISAVLNNEETILPAEVKAEICTAAKRHAGIILNQHYAALTCIMLSVIYS